MNIWELSLSSIDFTTFRLPEAERVDQFSEFVDQMGDTSQPLKNKWKPFVLLKDEQRIDPDFFDLYDLGCVVVSSIVSKMIYSTMDENDYEMLPFISENDEYYLFNCLKTIDCLIKEESVVDSLESGVIADYTALTFDCEKINKVPCFKIPELPYTLFITTAFKFLYDELELKGIDFEEENLVYVG